MPTNRKNFRSVIAQTLMVFGILCLTACSTDDKEKSVKGQAVKGVITQGVVRAYDLEDLSKPVAQTRTDEDGQFTFDADAVEKLEAIKDIYIEVSTDSSTRMICDITSGCEERISGVLVPFGEKLKLPQYFKLSGIGSGASGSTKNIQISPLSHLIISTAKAINPTLSIQSISVANQWVREAFNLDFDPLTTRTSDITSSNKLSAANIHELSQALFSAALYHQAISLEWSQGEIEVSELDIQATTALATEIASQLSALYDTEHANETSLSQKLNSLSLSRQSTAYAAPDTTPLTVISHPQSTRVNENSEVVLYVLASSSEAISYQWFKDDQAIPGATSASHTITRAQLSDAAHYHVVASTQSESVTSLSALVQVEETVEPVVISSHPSSITLNEGETIQLEASVTGDGPLQYQWQKGGSIIPNETSPSLVIDAASLSDGGTYRVNVSNQISNASSNFATVTVNEKLYPPSISSQPQSLTLTEGANGDLSAFAQGSGFLSYQWFKDGQAIGGENDSTLSFSPARREDAGSYQLRVSNTLGTSLSSLAELIVIPNIVPLTITQAPVGQQIYQGENIRLNVHTTGDEPNYQWFKNGQVIVGATNQELLISNASEADEGSYTVKVSNPVSDLMSGAAGIAILPRPTVELTWDTPQLREDSTELSPEDISGYVIQYGYAATELDSFVHIDNAYINSYVIENLKPRSSLYARIATKDIAGQQSRFSATIRIDL